MAPKKSIKIFAAASNTLARARKVRAATQAVGPKRERKDLQTRINELRNDKWVLGFDAKTVTCKACRSIIRLDKRNDYYLGFWIKHKGRCTMIREQKKSVPPEWIPKKYVSKRKVVVDDDLNEPENDDDSDEPKIDVESEDELMEDELMEDELMEDVKATHSSKSSGRVIRSASAMKNVEAAQSSKGSVRLIRSASAMPRREALGPSASMNDVGSSISTSGTSISHNPNVSISTNLDITIPERPIPDPIAESEDSGETFKFLGGPYPTSPMSSGPMNDVGGSISTSSTSVSHNPNVSISTNLNITIPERPIPDPIAESEDSGDSFKFLGGPYPTFTPSGPMSWPQAPRAPFRYPSPDSDSDDEREVTTTLIPAHWTQEEMEVVHAAHLLLSLRHSKCCDSLHRSGH